MQEEPGGYDGSKFVAGKEKMKLPFTEKQKQNDLARKIENYDGQTVSVFPEVINGLAKVGQFDQLDIKHVRAVKADGTTVEMINPADAVLSGQATNSETVDFILRKLRNVLPQPALDKEGQKEQILKIWKTAQQRIQAVEQTRIRAGNTIQDAHEKAAGWGEQREQLKRGEGEHAEAWKADLESRDQVVLEQLREELRKLSQEFASIDKDLPWEG